MEEVLIKLNRIEEMIKVSASMPQKSHLKVNEACKFLSVSKNTLTKICIEYNIHPIKIGGVNYYSVKELQQVFKQ